MCKGNKIGPMLIHQRVSLLKIEEKVSTIILEKYVFPLYL